MLRKNLPFMLIVLLTLLLIALVIWVFARRISKLDDKMPKRIGAVKTLRRAMGVSEKDPGTVAYDIPCEVSSVQMKT
jgi:hypothetical protein